MTQPAKQKKHNTQILKTTTYKSSLHFLRETMTVPDYEDLTLEEAMAKASQLQKGEEIKARIYSEICGVIWQAPSDHMAFCLYRGTATSHHILSAYCVVQSPHINIFDNQRLESQLKTTQERRIPLMLEGVIYDANADRIGNNKQPNPIFKADKIKFVNGNNSIYETNT